MEKPREGHKSDDMVRLEKLRDETGLSVTRLQDLEKRGFAVVRSTRAADLLMKICDDILDVQIGTLVFWRTDEELRQDAFAQYVHYHLLAASQELGWSHYDSSALWNEKTNDARILDLQQTVIASCFVTQDAIAKGIVEARIGDADRKLRAYLLATLDWAARDKGWDRVRTLGLAWAKRVAPS